MILSLVTLTFLALDQFNPTLFGKTFFHAVLLVYGVAVMILSFTIITRKQKKKPNQDTQSDHPNARLSGDRNNSNEQTKKG